MDGLALDPRRQPGSVHPRRDTRTWILGSAIATARSSTSGPDVDDHVRALASAVEGADRVSIVVTHRHGDHAAAARPLAESIGAKVLGPSEVEGVDLVLSDGDNILTDAGPLTAVHTPGHTREHLSIGWSGANALFVGDLLLGEGDTTWVAEYPGCVADYLGALERVRSIGCSILYPAHGPPITDPSAAIDRFEQHRRSRIDQVRTVLDATPEATTEEVLEAVYGPDLPASVRGAARQSLDALIEYARGTT